MWKWDPPSVGGCRHVVTISEMVVSSGLTWLYMWGLGRGKKSWELFLVTQREINSYCESSLLSFVNITAPCQFMSIPMSSFRFELKGFDLNDHTHCQIFRKIVKPELKKALNNKKQNLNLSISFKLTVYPLSRKISLTSKPFIFLWA